MGLGRGLLVEEVKSAEELGEFGIESRLILPARKIKDVVFHNLLHHSLRPGTRLCRPAIIQRNGTKCIAAEFLFELAGFANLVFHPVTFDRVLGEDEQDGGILTDGAVNLCFQAACGCIVDVAPEADAFGREGGVEVVYEGTVCMGVGDKERGDLDSLGGA